MTGVPAQEASRSCSTRYWNTWQPLRCPHRLPSLMPTPMAVRYCCLSEGDRADETLLRTFNPFPGNGRIPGDGHHRAARYAIDCNFQRRHPVEPVSHLASASRAIERPGDFLSFL